MQNNPDFETVRLNFEDFHWKNTTGTLPPEENLDISDITSIGLQIFGAKYDDDNEKFGMGPATLELDYIKLLK